MLIRPIETRDVDAWAAMRKRLWPEADAVELAQEARAFTAGPTKAMLDAAFLAEDETRPIGFVELSVRPFSDGCDSMPVPHVEGWYVEESARGHGIGRALMSAAEDWARARGFKELASDAQLSNAGAQRAHAQCGFNEVERLIKFRKALT